MPRKAVKIGQSRLRLTLAIVDLWMNTRGSNVIQSVEPWQSRDQIGFTVKEAHKEAHACDIFNCKAKVKDIVYSQVLSGLVAASHWQVLDGTFGQNSSIYHSQGTRCHSRNQPPFVTTVPVTSSFAPPSAISSKLRKRFLRFSDHVGG